MESDTPLRKVVSSNAARKRANSVALGFLGANFDNVPDSLLGSSWNNRSFSHSTNNPFASVSVREETASLAELALEDSFVENDAVDKTLIPTPSRAPIDATPFPYRRGSLNPIGKPSGSLGSVGPSENRFSGGVPSSLPNNNPIKDFPGSLGFSKSDAISSLQQQSELSGESHGSSSGTTSLLPSSATEPAPGAASNANVSYLSTILKGKTSPIDVGSKADALAASQNDDSVSPGSSSLAARMYRSSSRPKNSNYSFSTFTSPPQASQASQFSPLLDSQDETEFLIANCNKSAVSNMSPELEYQPSYGSIEHDGNPSPNNSLHTPSQLRKQIGVWAQENFTKQSIFENAVRRPISYIPSVFLGTLLNILDGLSYGLILFPTSIPVYSNLGPSGLSIFYVSCVISQFCFSLGLSKFPAGVGSEMIEVVPFFHIIASTLVADIGEDNPGSILATTLVAFSLSSVITGIVFFVLGYLKAGNMISFFPRHILVGCVGGVGYFLFITGIGVSSGLGEEVPYTLQTLYFLFTPNILIKWITPLAIAGLLVYIQHKHDEPFVVPAYFLTIFFAIHAIIYAIPNYSFEQARIDGWLFNGPQNKDEPWWYFYTLFDFKAIDFGALIKTVPTMFALTFFGILHVPINVPALASALKSDDIDVNRELIAHGVSNTLSGLCGSIQNYLVYTNSVLVIKTGADSRLAGIMLGLATMGVMFIGPVVVGYIPVPVVAALIFLLAHDLLKESLWDTFRVANNYEYLTIFAIVGVMGIYDFVWGIVFGIILACGFFTIKASSASVIRATFTGSVARSTVRRNANIQKYLSHVGDQIYVMKISGSVFFGTINEIETHIKALIDDVQFRAQPIRYLILDMMNVSDLDFSAMKGFYNIKRRLDTKGVFMLISSPDEEYMMKMLKANEMDGKSYADTAMFRKWSSSSSPAGSLKGNSPGNLIAFEDEEPEVLEQDSEGEEYEAPVALVATPNVTTVATAYNLTKEEEEEEQSLEVIRLFPTLNSALEWCENKFMRDYFDKRGEVIENVNQHRPTSGGSSSSSSNNHTISIPGNSSLAPPFSNNSIAGSPRVSFIQKAAVTAVHSDPEVVESRSRWKHYKEPLPLLLKTFNGVTTKREDFWHRVAPFFVKVQLKSGQILYRNGAEAKGFYVVESGILRADHTSEQGNLSESIVAGTTCGELPFFSATTRSATVLAETDSTVWKLDRGSWEAIRQLKPNGLEIANELYLIALKLTVERYDTNLAYTLISSV